MKYLVILGDGMADVPNPALGGRTPLEAAVTPNFDMLAQKAQIGRVATIPEGFKPGSDIANLSVMGYAPEKYYSGRSPLEALSIGVEMKDTDVAVRTNLVTLSEGNFPDKIMEDYSAGEISTAESKQLIEALESALGNEKFKLYPGVSYRHCLIIDRGTTETVLTPPHDISGKNISGFLPSGEGGEELAELIIKSEEILKNHPVNLARIKAGKNPATHIWFWGAGVKPKLDPFEQKFGLKGAVVSAVDLLKGIAIGAGMKCPEVRGATGTLETNWQGKADAAKECFESGADYVYIHMEAPDECGHQGDLEGKIKAIEKVDWMTGEMFRYLESKGEDFCITVTPDHATPLNVKTHTREPIPYIIYKSNKPLNMGLKYTEKEARSGVFLANGQLIMSTMTEE